MQAEQGLANVALRVAQMQKEVKQHESELQAAERQRRVEAALGGQMPRLQQWQNRQVGICTVIYCICCQVYQQHIMTVQTYMSLACHGIQRSLHYKLSTLVSCCQLQLMLQHAGFMQLMCCLQTSQQSNSAQLESALSNALQYVPLVNGACIGDASNQVCLIQFILTSMLHNVCSSQV